ncbi:MAG: hypothetical protein LBQ15_06105 [Clostridium sp.]|nr:hypothetical protein [Clostridium sp.]
MIGQALLEIMEENDKVVVLSSDVSVSVNTERIHERYPERFFETGIAEQSTVSVAGGLVMEGFLPVYVALAIFSCEMTFAQTRQVCNANLHVKIIGTHPGVDYGEDGSRHHANEDLALARAIPRMTVLAPSDCHEVAAAIREAVELDGPVYIRAARVPQPEIHEKGCKFEIAKAEVIYDQEDEFAILYEGSALRQAMEGWKRTIPPLEDCTAAWPRSWRENIRKRWRFRSALQMCLPNLGKKRTSKRNMA